MHCPEVKSGKKYDVWLIGVGPMAIEYVKVLKALKRSVLPIGRSEQSAAAFKEKTGICPFVGGLSSFLNECPPLPEKVIVCTGVEQLAPASQVLMSAGVRSLLIEKPAGLTVSEVVETDRIAKEKKAKAWVAYNRRYYSSVQEAKKIITEDGGVSSLHFEFTEWVHIIEPLKKAEGVKQHLVLNNSSHVIDMAFFLGGYPQQLSSYNAGSLSWHPSSSIFCGAGVTDLGALFSYHANWTAPGRWGVEVATRKSRLIFRPLERLFIQKHGSVAVNPVEIDYTLDEQFKPGLYRQVEAFFMEKTENMCHLSDHAKWVSSYAKMAGYHID